MSDQFSFSYEDLANHILTQLTPEQRKQKVQIASPEPDGDKPVLLDCFVCIDTVENLFEDMVVIDNLDGKTHPEHVVILTDWCNFGANGSAEASWDDFVEES